MKWPDSQTPTQGDAPTGPVPTILQAIVERRCLTATYNRGVVTLAPHIIYTRHGELHVDGVALERDGNRPREPKLGTYRLSGLGDIALTDRPFQPFETFRAADPKYEGVALIAVDFA